MHGTCIEIIKMDHLSQNVAPFGSTRYIEWLKGSGIPHSTKAIVLTGWKAELD